jgi:ABC-type phosphate transport system permease subunit
MKLTTRRLAAETAALMLFAGAIDLALFAYTTVPFWGAVAITSGIYIGADTYYQHHAQGGHEDE